MQPRRVVTVSGEIGFERAVWQCSRCRASQAPLDWSLGLRSRRKWTRGVERKSAFAAAISAYGEASETLRKLADLSVSSSEVDRIAQEHGAELDALQRAEEEVWREPQDPLRPGPEPRFSCQRLVVQADATSVLTVNGEEHKSVYCGTAFGLAARGKSGERPFLSERLYAASAENMEDFAERLRALAWRAGMRGASQTAFMGDGARCLWKWAEENLPAGTVFIQDFWHVCERLSQLAQSLFGQTWRQTFERWKRQLRASRVASILRALGQLRQERRGEARQAIDAEIAYLEAGRHRMDYARYEREGWPIGSGAIEGTCKHLIKSRFALTGARWRRRNIPQVLALRLALFNEEWDDYWETRPAA